MPMVPSGTVEQSMIDGRCRMAMTCYFPFVAGDAGGSSAAEWLEFHKRCEPQSAWLYRISSENSPGNCLVAQRCQNLKARRCARTVDHRPTTNNSIRDSAKKRHLRRRSGRCLIHHLQDNPEASA